MREWTNGGEDVTVSIGGLRERSNKVNSKYIDWFVIETWVHKTMLQVSRFVL